MTAVEEQTSGQTAVPAENTAFFRSWFRSATVVSIARGAARVSRAGRSSADFTMRLVLKFFRVGSRVALGRHSISCPALAFLVSGLRAAPG